jgi:hypothetical protein
MARESKAQTVVKRAARRAVLGTQLTSHTCASPNCSSPGERIALGDLYPVVTMAPHRHTVFFHRACAPQVTGPR